MLGTVQIVSSTTTATVVAAAVHTCTLHCSVSCECVKLLELAAAGVLRHELHAQRKQPAAATVTAPILSIMI
jgi:hypothetical protein